MCSLSLTGGSGEVATKTVGLNLPSEKACATRAAHHPDCGWSFSFNSFNGHCICSVPGFLCGGGHYSENANVYQFRSGYFGLGGMEEEMDPYFYGEGEAEVDLLRKQREMKKKKEKEEMNMKENSFLFGLFVGVGSLIISVLVVMSLYWVFTLTINPNQKLDSLLLQSTEGEEESKISIRRTEEEEKKLEQDFKKITELLGENGEPVNLTITPICSK